jgi:MFS family permease
LPNIQQALHFSTTSLSWVLNAYTLTFGGLLLLGGRAGDILGRRRVFVFGIALFTLASFLGGLATSPGSPGSRRSRSAAATSTGSSVRCSSGRGWGRCSCR